MLHPSYSDLMKKVNSEVEEGDTPIVNSRYSIVLATAKRARQIVEGAETLYDSDCPKPLSIAVDELYNAKIKVLSNEDYEKYEQELIEKDRVEALRREYEMKAKEDAQADGEAVDETLDSTEEGDA
ncbi:MAG: DNA-directed RNA polymerase subunit omega [Lachnospiraceae bacterium]|nr:DNA-directed RNA polymerase subunit omega [Lachnospiraceae bacterium]